MTGGVANLVNHGGVNAIEHSDKNLPAALNDNAEDCDGDYQTHDRVGQWVA